MDGNAKLSIVDVAKRAGVSTATVSRVINHNGGYSRETEEKVRRTIEECGFTPNANAIGLRTNKSRCIGVIVPDVTNEFFAKIIQELDFYLLKHGYSLLICNSNEDYELENMHIKGLIEKHIDGIVYISGQNEIKNINEIKHIPVVYIDRAPLNARMLILDHPVPQRGIHKGFERKRHPLQGGTGGQLLPGLCGGKEGDGSAGPLRRLLL